MLIQKNDIFVKLSKNQKSSLVSYIRNLSKKHFDKSSEDILYIFIEEETYYFNVGNPHFEWVIELFEDENFLKEIKFLIRQYKLQNEEKERQKPFIEKQKQYIKEQNKKLREIKMSREKPTPKQLKYYKNLCKKHNIEKIDMESLSKLDLKNLISKALERSDCNVQEIID